MDELTWRPATLDDAPALTRLTNVLMAHDGWRDAITEDVVREELQHPGWDRERDSLVAVEPDGEILAYGAMMSPPAGGTFARTEGGVHPDRRGLGLGRRVLAFYLDRARARHAEAGGTTPWELHVGAVDADKQSERLFARAGLKPVRYWFEMERPVAGQVPDTAIVEGLRLQPFTPELARALHAAHTEAFADHWGSQPRPFEQWEQYALAGSGFRPEQTVLAIAADGTVGGYLMSFQWADTTRMIMGTIGVRRPWRRKGVASALMARALQEYAAAGITTAGLDVDSANPSGAVGVYERMGFTPVMRTVTYAATIG